MNSSNPETSGIVQAGSVKYAPETMPLAVQEILENMILEPEETGTHVPNATVEMILLDTIVPLQPGVAKRVDMTALDIGGGPAAQVAAEVQHHVSSLSLVPTGEHIGGELSMIPSVQLESVNRFKENAPLALQDDLWNVVFPPELEVRGMHAPKSIGLKLAFATIVPLQLGKENRDVV